MLSTLVKYSPLSLLSGFFSNYSIIKVPNTSDFDEIKLIFIKDEGVVHDNKSNEIILAYDSINNMINGNESSDDNSSTMKKICVLSNNSSLIPSSMKENLSKNGLLVYNENFNIMTTAGLICYKVNEIILNQYKKSKKSVRFGFVGGKKLFKILKDSINEKNNGKAQIYRITKKTVIPKNIDYILLGCINKNDNNVLDAITELMKQNKTSKILIYNNTKEINMYSDTNLSYQEIIELFNINEEIIQEIISIYNYNLYIDKMKKYYENHDNNTIMFVSNNFDELNKLNSEGYKTCLTLTNDTTYKSVENKIKSNPDNKIDFIIPDLSYIKLK